MSHPIIKAANRKKFTCKQSKYSIAPEALFRAVCYGPTGSGKSILLQQLILDINTECFERIYIWSPSLDIHHVWDPVRKDIRKELKVDTKKEKCLFSMYNPKELSRRTTRKSYRK